MANKVSGQVGLVRSRPRAARVVVTGRRTEGRAAGRMPGPVAVTAAFAADLPLAAGFALWHPAPVPAVVLLAVVAAVLGWCTTVPGALGAGVLGWLFYDGFVDHTGGQLGLTGAHDAVVALVLAGVGVLGTLAQAALRRTNR